MDIDGRNVRSQLVAQKKDVDTITDLLAGSQSATTSKAKALALHAQCRRIQVDLGILRILRCDFHVLDLAFTTTLF
jgi:hypothetical protein